MINMIDIKMCCCIIIATLFLVFPDTILTTFPMIRNLFNDNVNYILLITLVILTLLIDLHCGIIFALAVVFMSMYIDTQSKSSIVIRKNDAMTTKAMTTNAMTTNAMTTNAMTTKAMTTKAMTTNAMTTKAITNNINNNKVNNERKVKFIEEPNVINSTNDTIRSDSEFIYDTTKPFPNNNIKPFQHNSETSTATIVSNNANNVNGVQDIVDNECQNDFLTQNGQPDRSGYDINGCRYDMKNSPQNLTKYGPPLSHCGTYDVDKLTSCGTLFYPLNA